MFESIIKEKSSSIIDSIDFEKEFVFLSDILNNKELDIHSKAYFSAEADWWIYQEKLHRFSSENFDSSDRGIKEEFKKLEGLFKKNAKFSKRDISIVAESAAKTRLNMLCRPRTALEWFVFRNESVKTYSEIHKRMNYLSDYHYLINGYKSWAESNGLDGDSEKAVSRAEFSRKITEIDNETIYELTPEQFVDLLLPLFNYFGADGCVPMEAIIVFLDDKSISPMARALERLLREENCFNLSISEFREFIFAMLEELGEFDETDRNGKIGHGPESEDAGTANESKSGAAYIEKYKQKEISVAKRDCIFPITGHPCYFSGFNEFDEADFDESSCEDEQNNIDPLSELTDQIRNISHCADGKHAEKIIAGAPAASKGEKADILGELVKKMGALGENETAPAQNNDEIEVHEAFPQSGKSDQGDILQGLIDNLSDLGINKEIGASLSEDTASFSEEGSINETVEAQSDVIADIQNKLENLVEEGISGAETEKMKQKNPKMKQKNPKMKQKNSKMKQKNPKMKQKNSKMKQKNPKMKQKNPKMIAFFQEIMEQRR